MGRLIYAREETESELTSGAKYLVNFLKEKLDNLYEIFVRPHLNGDQIDIVILKKGLKVIIINIVEFNPEDYEYKKESANWIHKNTNIQIRSPLFRIEEHKDNFFRNHIPGLAEANITNNLLYGIITPCIYFHNASKNTLNKLSQEYKNQYTKIFCYEMLALEESNTKRLFNKTANLLDDELYNKFKSLLSPISQSTIIIPRINFTSKQMQLIEKDTKKSIIFGIAGSGKTTVLAHRANYLSKKHQNKEKILILTYNITLRKHIENKIRETGINNDRIVILHYHEFVTRYRRNHNLPHCINPDKKGFEYIITKKDVEKAGEKYKIILVDEVQDFEEGWIKSIENILDSDGEISFFGDEEQALYGHGKNHIIKSPKKAFLKRTFRMKNETVDLANAFRKYFMEADTEIETRQKSIFESTPIFVHIEERDSSKIIDIYNAFVEMENIKDKNICIVGPQISTLRHLDKCFRKNKEYPSTTFETQEVFEKVCYEVIKNIKYRCPNIDLKNDLNKNFTKIFENDPDGKSEPLRVKLKEKIETKLYNIRKSKKFNFDSKEAAIKISTIHSFKGLEAENCILLIEEGTDASTASAIYTGLTRGIERLCVINIGTWTYHEFFASTKENIRIFNYKSNQLSEQDMRDIKKEDRSNIYDDWKEGRINLTYPWDELELWNEYLSRHSKNEMPF